MKPSPPWMRHLPFQGGTNLRMAVTEVPGEIGRILSQDRQTEGSGQDQDNFATTCPKPIPIIRWPSTFALTEIDRCPYPARRMSTFYLKGVRTVCLQDRGRETAFLETTPRTSGLPRRVLSEKWPRTAFRGSIQATLARIVGPCDQGHFERHPHQQSGYNPVPPRHRVRARELRAPQSGAHLLTAPPAFLRVPSPSPSSPPDPR